MQLVEDIPELGFRRGAILRSVGAFGVGGQMVGDRSEDLNVPLDSTRGASALPAGGQRCIEPVQPGRGDRFPALVFFFLACFTIW